MPRSSARRPRFRLPARGPRSRPSASRGQVEPLAALAALVVLGAALTAYGAVARDALPDARDRNLAEPALTETLADARSGAVVLPGRLASAAAAAVESAAPAGFRLNASVAAGNRTWSVGPRPPAIADSAGADATDVASRTVPARIAPGRVRVGRLRVVVWR